MTELLEHITLEPDHPADAVVVWLHGLGADGHDFEQIVPELKLPDGHRIRFIFPHAPIRPVSINNGEEMRAWYDFIPHSEHEGADDISRSADDVRAFVDAAIEAGIDPSRIVLAGFSQGGVMALHTGLRLNCRIAGIAALSTYLYDVSTVDTERTDENLAIPILMAHGTRDPMIPIMRAATSRENLIRLGYDVRWFDYSMGHQVCLPEVEEISRFLQEILG
jgi:phospholipase/carboxylesterase